MRERERENIDHGVITKHSIFSLLYFLYLETQISKINKFKTKAR